MILTQSTALDLVLLAAAPAIGLGAIYALLTWRWQPKHRSIVPMRTLSPGEATLLRRRWKAASHGTERFMAENAPRPSERR